MSSPRRCTRMMMRASGVAAAAFAFTAPHAAHAGKEISCDPYWISNRLSPAGLRDAFGVAPGVITAVGQIPTADGPRLIIAQQGPPGPGVAFQPFRTWDGEAFTNSPPGQIGTMFGLAPLRITEIEPFDLDGTGPASPKLAVAGNFTQISGQPAIGIAIWNGSSWIRPLTDGDVPIINTITTLGPPFTEPDSPRLFIGGRFDTIGVDQAAFNNVAMWDPSSGTWISMNGGLFGNGNTVYDSVVFDSDGPFGDEPTYLYACGSFNLTEGGPAGRIARWNGESWENVPAGILAGPVAYSLLVWDPDGAGESFPSLSVAGDFSVTGVLSDNVATLSTFGWTPVAGSGTIPIVRKLFALDPDGQSFTEGDELYAVHEMGFSRLINNTWNTITTYSGVNDAENVRGTVIDDDGDGLRGRSIVLTGVQHSPEFFDWAGLDRWSQADFGLVTATQSAVLNSDSTYLCDRVPTASETVIFDLLRTSVPSLALQGSLFDSISFAGLQALSGDTTINIAGSTLSLEGTSPISPSLVVGDGPQDARLIFEAVSRGFFGFVSTQDVVVGRDNDDTDTDHVLAMSADTRLQVAGDLVVARESFFARLFIEDGAELSTQGNVTVGQAFGSAGAIFIDEFANWSHTAPDSTITVGYDGSGQIALLGNSATWNSDASQLRLGDRGGFGTIALSSGAEWNHLGSSIILGQSGGAAFRIIANTFGNTTTVANFSSGASIRTAVNPGSFATIELFAQSGASATLNAAGSSLFIGTEQGEAGLTLFGPGTAVNAGTLEIGRRGFVRGNGSIFLDFTTGQMINRGTIDICDDDFKGGCLPGVLTIIGSFQQLSAAQNAGVPGRLVVDLYDSGNDRLHFVEPATVGGQIDVRLGLGYTPAPGSLVDGVMVITSESSIAGGFEVANLPGLPASNLGAGRFLRIERVTSPGVSVEVVDVIGFRVIEATLDEPLPEANTTTEYDVGGAGTDAALGDFDLDGDLDLAVTIPDSVDPVNNPGSIAVLFNGGSTGGFWNGFTSTRQVAAPRNPSSITVADFDGQNGPDIAVTSLTDNTVAVLYNPGAGLFTPALPENIFEVGVAPIWIGHGNFGGDLLPDIVTSNQGDSTLTIWFNNVGALAQGERGFSSRRSVPISGSLGPAIVMNYDNDKWDDVVVTQPEEGNTISVTRDDDTLRGAADFAVVATRFVGGRPVAIDRGDLNLDGILDVVVSLETDDAVATLLGDGGPAFSAPLTVPTGDQPGSLTLANLDGDADLDIAVISTDELGNRSIRLIRNDLFGGQLNFATQTDLLPGAPPKVLLAGDVTGDASPDLITVNQSGGVQFVAQPASAILRSEAESQGMGPMRSDVTVFAFEACRGDANNDRVVNSADINVIFVNWNVDYRPGTGPGDADANGVVDFRDITRLLQFFGRTCD